MKVIDYSAAFARIRAIRGELLNKEVLEEALNSKSLEGLVDIIKKTPYGKDKPLPYSREGLERLLKSSIIDIYLKVLEFMPKRSREFLKATIKRFEIDNIKRILTSKLKNGEEISKEALYDLKGLSYLDIDELLSARKLSEAVEVLRKSSYGEYLEGKLPEEDVETIFGIEMILDYGFFKELIQLNETLDPIDKDINNFYFGMQCDLINLGWIIRAKNYFSLREEKIFSYTLPFGRYLNNKKLKELTQAKKIEDFLKPLSNTPWGEEIGKFTDLKDPLIERKLLKRFYNSVTKSPLIRNNLFSIGSFIELLCQKEMEIYDLTVIIESKAYDIPPETVRPLLLKVG
ncbi:MAG: V-type ATPase subunit [Synergistetes bacterium]|nr:V-type ATPase subunit [Synergistota bacterium]MCX8128314.1 V-type ATPase subunit [Synergistota bacterium]MDW8192633.1 V-type ATPase subunit [Synergistota bacterium]